MDRTAGAGVVRGCADAFRGADADRLPPCRGRSPAQRQAWRRCPCCTLIRTIGRPDRGGEAVRRPVRSVIFHRRYSGGRPLKCSHSGTMSSPRFVAADAALSRRVISRRRWAGGPAVPRAVNPFAPYRGAASAAPSHAAKALASVRTPAELAMLPAAVAFRAAPSQAPPQAIPAPVPAGTMPAVRIPAMPVSAEHKLYLIDQGKAIGRRIHAYRNDRGVCGACDG
jgi:hypothetical protein